MDLKDTYNKIAEDWHADHKNDIWWLEGTGSFCSLLKKGDKVLDVGCGSGLKSKYLYSKGFDVTGIDLSDKLIDIARRESPGIEFVVMDMKDADKLNRSFDGIFAQASLLHIPKKEVMKVLETLVKALKPNGYFYIGVKAKNPEGVEESILKESDYGYPYERFFSYFTMDQLKSYFNGLKLDIVYENSQIFGKTRWLQIVGKKSHCY